MKKIRRGNDFVFAWEIERNGLPEDLSSVLEKHLYLSALGKRVEMVEGVDYDITGNVVRIEVTPTIATILGTYKAEFHYILPDLGFIDEDRKCAVDVDAFVIVGSTEQADNPSEFTITSDMAIAFKGDKGDSSYQTWLDAGNTGTEADYLAWIRQPATDIEQAVSSNETVRISSEETRQLNETARVEAETLRGSAETQRISDENTRKSNETGRVNAETLRLSAEEERGTAEGQRATAETSRATAEGLRAAAETARVNNESARQSAEELRQTNTAEAIQSANTAAQQADTARGELTTQVSTKIGEADTKIIEMNTLMSGYDNRVINLEVGKVDKQTFADLATVRITNLIRNGNFANGTTYFSSIYNYSLTVEDNTLMTAVTQILTISRAFVSHSLQNTTIIGNKYYITIDIQPKYNSNSRIIMGGWDSRNIDPILMVGMQWNRKSYVFTATQADLKVHFFSNIDETGYVIGDVIKFKNWMCIDLTSTFGSGNEPTKEEIDTLISILGSDYFEGELTLSQKQIMNWQLKMIRQNRNAIIALGGTII